MSKTKTINVKIIIDTESVMAEYSHPSKDPRYPTGIEYKYLYTLSSDMDGIHGDADASVNLKVRYAAPVRVYVTSRYNNTLYPAVLVQFAKFSGTDIFQGTLTPQVPVEAETVVPSQAEPLVLRSPNPKAYHWVSQSTIAAPSATGSYLVSFAVYDITYSLYGYFQCEINVHVAD